MLAIHTDIPEEELISELQEAVEDRLEVLGVDATYVGIAQTT
jgi:hypothetical protein